MVESKQEVTSTYHFDSQLNLASFFFVVAVVPGMVVSTGALGLRVVNNCALRKTTFKELFVFRRGHFPLNIKMCPVADTALAATSNCPAPKYFVQTSDSATLSAQSRFHVGTERKKKNKRKTGVGVK